MSAAAPLHGDAHSSVAFFRARLEEINNEDKRSRRDSSDPLHAFPSFDLWISQTERELVKIYGEVADISVEVFQLRPSDHRNVILYVRLPHASGEYLTVEVMLHLYADRITLPIAPDYPLRANEDSTEVAFFYVLADWLGTMIDNSRVAVPLAKQSRVLRARLRKKLDTTDG